MKSPTDTIVTLRLVITITLMAVFVVGCQSNGCQKATSPSSLVKDIKNGMAPSDATPLADLFNKGTPRTFEEGREEARSDYLRTVKVTFTSITWIALAGIGGSIALAGLSIFFPWASLKAALVGGIVSFAAVLLSISLRYVMLTYGTLTLDVLVWVALGTGLLFGAAFAIPIAISWWRRNIRNTVGSKLAAEAASETDPTKALAKGREATLALALSDRNADTQRSLLPSVFTMNGDKIHEAAKSLKVTLPKFKTPNGE